MCVMSDREISVPMLISAASLTAPSSSSGRIDARSVEEAFVRKPEQAMSAPDSFLQVTEFSYPSF